MSNRSRLAVSAFLPHYFLSISYKLIWLIGYWDAVQIELFNSKIYIVPLHSVEIMATSAVYPYLADRSAKYIYLFSLIQQHTKHPLYV